MSIFGAKQRRQEIYYGYGYFDELKMEDTDGILWLVFIHQIMLIF